MFSYFPRAFLFACLILYGHSALAMAEVRAQHPGQQALVNEVVHETGQSAHQLNVLLNQAKKQQSVLDAIARPAESKPWKEYRAIFLTPKRIKEGIDFFRQHRALLEHISQQYGVEPQFLVAIIGVETFYGQHTGYYNVLDALVTLGFYYPSRSKYFRNELKTLLELPPSRLAGPINALTGSYTGAQGWAQFMPSSIRDYGVDADHNGRIDLQNSYPDILASIANYFSKHGWIHGGQVVARAQSTAAAKPLHIADSKPQWTLEKLKSWGYTPLQKFNTGQLASLLKLNGDHGVEYWFTFQNFYVITKYNRSPLYAMAVTQLAQAIASGVGATAQ